MVAVLRGEAEPADGRERQVVLRGDMDGLPVAEELGLDYASTHEGSTTRAATTCTSLPSWAPPASCTA